MGVDVGLGQRLHEFCSFLKGFRWPDLSLGVSLRFTIWDHWTHLDLDVPHPSYEVLELVVLVLRDMAQRNRTQFCQKPVRDSNEATKQNFSTRDDQRERASDLPNSSQLTKKGSIQLGIRSMIQ